MNRFAMIPKTRSVPAALAALALLALPTLVLSACGSTSAEPPLAGAQIGGPFELTGESGDTVRWADFAGKYRIIYFGYAFCPDVCPHDVAFMMQGYEGFKRAHPDLAAQVQPLFVTIDPARDTPEVVGEFTDAFSPDLLGLTGTQAQIDAATKAFAVYARKGDATPGGGYLMDHSRGAYLMGRQGEPIALLPVEQSGAAVQAELEKWVS